MKRLKVNARNIGLIYENNQAYARVWAPMAKQVSLALEQNRTYMLERDEFGYWAGTLPAQPGNLYHFSVDRKLLPDPASLSQPKGVHGPSQIFDSSAFQWTDDTWQNPAIDNYIFYELHTGTFTPEGTFVGIESKLDYLCTLGVTAIEIMPVAQFPGKRNWGYDGVYPFAVQHSYGTPQQLQQLVNKCHEKGLAVVLDVVYNHVGPEGSCLSAYGPYFTDKYKTPWGQGINFDDAWCDAVRDYYIENALMWFRDFHIDALRLDAVHAIYDFSAKHILRELKEYTDELMASTGKTYHLIVESDLNDSRFIDSMTQGGYGMGAQWNDEFHHALRVCAGGERTGYFSDFTGLPDLAKCYKNAYVHDGVYSPFRKKTFGNATTDNAGNRFVVFSQNHDQIGNRALGERTSVLLSFEMLKLLAGAVLVSPYLPLLFMGEEWGATTPFQYFINHEDETLIRAVREGRQNEFAHFFAGKECPDPQAEETFLQCKLSWSDLDNPKCSVLQQYYTRLIHLRKSTPALYVLNRHHLNVLTDANAQTLMLHRWHGQQHVACIMNFSEKKQQVAVPWRIPNLEKTLDSAAIEWNGPGEACTSETDIIIQPQSLIIYNNQNV